MFLCFLFVIFSGSSSAEQAGKEKEDASDSTETENLRSSKVAIIEYLRSKSKYILLYLLQNFFIYFLLYSYYVSYHIAYDISGHETKERLRPDPRGFGTLLSFLTRLTPTSVGWVVMVMVMMMVMMMVMVVLVVIMMTHYLILQSYLFI